MKRIYYAFQFLTIFPLAYGSAGGDERDIGKSSAWFPLVGLLQGLLLAALSFLAGRLFSAEITAGLLVCMLTVSNGGFHIDGLSDTFDALASKQDKEKMIEIMKDGTTGPIGVASVVLILLLKYILLKSVLSSTTAFVLPVILFPVVGKWSMVVALYQGKSASEKGLGRVFLDNAELSELLLASMTLVLIAAGVFLAGQGGAVDHYRFISLVAAFIGVAGVSLVLAGYFMKRLGGLTGDNLGAINEISEVLFLLLFLAVYTR